jgi:hypothetical protein
LHGGVWKVVGEEEMVHGEAREWAKMHQVDHGTYVKTFGFYQTRNDIIQLLSLSFMLWG